MKITFLGTCHGHPEKNREYTSIAVEANGRVYLFDTGAFVANKLLDCGLELTDLKSVFISHMHGDHVNGILRLVDIFSWANRLYDGIAVDYYFPEERGVNEIKAFCDAVKGPFNEEKNVFHIYPSDFVYDDGYLKVSVIETKHRFDAGFPSYAFLIEGEGKKVLITGDLSQDLKYDDFPKAAKSESTDLIICELAHFDFDTLRPHVMSCKTKMMYITHIKYPDVRIPLIEKENESSKFPFPIICPSDGDVIEL